VREGGHATRHRSALLRASRLRLLPALFLAASCQPLEIDLFRASHDAGIGASSPARSDASSDGLLVPPPLPASDASSAADLPAPVESTSPGSAGADAAPPGAVTPPAPPCLPGASACQDCEARQACPLGQVCHPQSGACVSPCAANEPRCPGALLCSPLGVCVECVSNGDCGAAAPERPACVAGLDQCGCASSADCGGARCELETDDSATPVAGHCEDEDD
jgi:hypothetical protein